MSEAVVVDSSGIVSLIVDTDSNHGYAQRIAAQLRTTNQPVIVPADVFTETVNVLGRTFGHARAFGTAQFLLETPEFLIAETTPELRQAAL